MCSVGQDVTHFVNVLDLLLAVGDVGFDVLHQYGILLVELLILGKEQSNLQF